MKIKAVILVGGHGTRLRPITHEIPKPLIPVKKKPIINHLIDFFHKSKVSEIGLLASIEHKEDFERWRKAWKSNIPNEKIKIFYEETRMGTFGGLRLLRDWLGNRPFILSNGDELKDFDLPSMIEFHKEHEGIATIAMLQVSNPSEYGVPVLEGDRIVEFLEKPENPPSNYINSGIYIMDPEIFNYADPDKEYIMNETDIFPKLAEKGLLYGKKLEGRWYDCGNLERWQKAIEEW